MEITIIIIMYFLIIWFDLMPLFKRGNKKEGIIYLTIAIITFVVLILNCIGIIVPSPATLIKYIIDLF